MIEYKLVSRHDFYETWPNKPEKRYPYLLIKHIHYELKNKSRGCLVFLPYLVFSAFPFHHVRNNDPYTSSTMKFQIRRYGDADPTHALRA